MNWQDIADGLRRWHERRDRAAARTVLEFLEPELRLKVPAIVRRRWPPDLVEDALRGFLLKVIERPLNSALSDPKAFFVASFRNHCIDLHMAHSRRPESHAVDASALADLAGPPEDSPAEALVRTERETKVRDALNRLGMADRVVLKLEHAAEWLADREFAWLANRATCPVEEVRRRLLDANDVHALSRIFDPGDDDPADPAARRLRMERFRRRRARARDRLWALLRGDA